MDDIGIKATKVFTTLSLTISFSRRPTGDLLFVVVATIIVFVVARIILV